jgi:hypothetical protein
VPAAYYSAVGLSCLPEDFRRGFHSLVLRSLPGGLRLPDVRSLVSVILLYGTSVTSEVDFLTPTEPLPDITPVAGRFGTDWHVALERTRDLPKYKHDTIGRFTVFSPREGWSKTLGLTMPRFVCVETQVTKSLEVLRSNGNDIGPEQVYCGMDRFEWAFDDFSQKHGNLSVGARKALFESVFEKNIRGFLFRVKESLRELGVDAIQCGRFPLGYFLNTHPSNITYKDSVLPKSGEER